MVTQGSNVSLARRRAKSSHDQGEVIGSPDRIPDNLQGLPPAISFHGIFAVET